jgi:hypothetical protein
MPILQTLSASRSAFALWVRCAVLSATSAKVFDLLIVFLSKFFSMPVRLRPPCPPALPEGGQAGGYCDIFLEIPYYPAYKTYKATTKYQKAGFVGFVGRVWGIFQNSHFLSSRPKNTLG